MSASSSVAAVFGAGTLGLRRGYGGCYEGPLDVAFLGELARRVAEPHAQLTTPGVWARGLMAVGG